MVEWDWIPCCSGWIFVDTTILRKQALLLEEVQKLNRENAERSAHQLSPGLLDLEAGVSSEDPQLGSTSPLLLDYLREEPKAPVAEEEHLSEGEKKEDEGQKVNESGVAVKEAESKPDEEEGVKKKEEAAAATTEAQIETESLKLPASHDSQNDSIPAR